MAKELKQKENTEMANLLAEDAGAGLEEATTDCYALPIMTLLQSMSKPCMEEPRPEGVRPGLIYDTTTKNTHESILVAPVYFQQRFVEWVPRTKGGGFVAIHDTMQPCRKDDFGNMLLENGNSLVDTRIHYVLVITENDSYPAMISMSSTNIKKSKLWCSQMKRHKMQKVNSDGSVEVIQLPTFSKLYILSTLKEQNDKGSWYNWDITLSDQEITSDDYKTARAFNAEFKSAESKYSSEQSFLQSEGV